jgi:cold shock CspA family protein
MARPQGTFNKKELEKKRMQKRKEKLERKEERKANAQEGQSWENMIAYVDENGNITTTPPDPTKKKAAIKTDDIVTGSRNISSHQVNTVKTGRVTFFNNSKGFGFIEDAESGERIFVHSNDLTSPIKENDLVAFETGRGVKGLKAIGVRLVE